MFSTSISPTKLRVKDSIFAILFLALFIVLLPFALIAMASLVLVSLVAFKVRASQIKRQSYTLFDAVKGRDYTVK